MGTASWGRDPVFRRSAGTECRDLRVRMSVRQLSRMEVFSVSNSMDLLRRVLSRVVEAGEGKLQRRPGR
jgi:hypothetical protein